MPQKRTWAALPTRRELTLALFALTVFVLSYNLEASLGLVGVRPQKLSSSYLLSIGECAPLHPGARRRRNASRRVVWCPGAGKWTAVIANRREGSSVSLWKRPCSSFKVSYWRSLR